MSDPLHLDLRTREGPGSVFRDIVLKHDKGGGAVTVWFEIVGASRRDEPKALDGFVFGILLYAMQVGAPLLVHGPVTRSALYNFEELQSFWHLWKPERYHRIEIRPDAIVDLDRRKPGRRAIAAFSGGVDSTFTALRHARRLDGSASFAVDTVLLVHGFDVALSSPSYFDGLIKRTEALLSDLRLTLEIMRTNSRELALMDWEDTFSSQLAACLHQYDDAFEFGLVGSSEPYNNLCLPWGSSPLTDGLLSGDRFVVVHDGAGYSRTAKVAALLRYPEVLGGIKVCWEGAVQDKNCGNCEKCMRTRLNFLAAGEPNPPCFDTPIDLANIAAIPIRNSVAFAELRSIADHARAAKIDGDWLRRLDGRLAAHEASVAAERRLRRVNDTLTAMGLKDSAGRAQAQIVRGLERIGAKEIVKRGLKSLRLIG